jgi:hypothetical protein
MKTFMISKEVVVSFLKKIMCDAPLEFTRANGPRQVIRKGGFSSPVVYPSNETDMSELLTMATCLHCGKTKSTGKKHEGQIYKREIFLNAAW